MSNHLFALMRSHMPAADRTFIESVGGGTLTYGGALDLSGRIANLLVKPVAAKWHEPAKAESPVTTATPEASAVR